MNPFLKRGESGSFGSGSSPNRFPVTARFSRSRYRSRQRPTMSRPRALSIQAQSAAMSEAAQLALAPLAKPAPLIDVWAWTQACAQALAHGVQPYTVRAPDIYRGGFNFGYVTTAYHYLPLNLILTAPVVALVGDYRWLLAACAVA